MNGKQQQEETKDDDDRHTIIIILVVVDPGLTLPSIQLQLHLHTNPIHHYPPNAPPHQETLPNHRSTWILFLFLSPAQPRLEYPFHSAPLRCGFGPRACSTQIPSPPRPSNLQWTATRAEINPKLASRHQELHYQDPIIPGIWPTPPPPPPPPRK